MDYIFNEEEYKVILQALSENKQDLEHFGKDCEILPLTKEAFNIVLNAKANFNMPNEIYDYGIKSWR